MAEKKYSIGSQTNSSVRMGAIDSDSAIVAHAIWDSALNSNSPAVIRLSYQSRIRKRRIALPAAHSVADTAAEYSLSRPAVS